MTFKEWWDQPTRVIMLPKGMSVKNGAAYTIAAEKQAREAWIASRNDTACTISDFARDMLFAPKEAE